MCLITETPRITRSMIKAVWPVYDYLASAAGLAVAQCSGSKKGNIFIYYLLKTF